MRERKLAISSAVLASLALAAVPWSARAAVIVKTFGFSICVTGKKHPDGCKSAGSYHFRQNGLLISSQRPPRRELFKHPRRIKRLAHF